MVVFQKLEGKTTTLNFWNQKLEGKTTTLKNRIKRMEGNSTTPKKFWYERSIIFPLVFSLIRFRILLRNYFYLSQRRAVKARDLSPVAKESWQVIHMRLPSILWNAHWRLGHYLYRHSSILTLIQGKKIDQ